MRRSERKKETSEEIGPRIETILSTRAAARKRIWAVESGKGKWVKRTNGSADVGVVAISADVDDEARHRVRRAPVVCNRPRETLVYTVCTHHLPCAFFSPSPSPSPLLTLMEPSVMSEPLLPQATTRYSFHFASTTCHEEVSRSFHLSSSFSSN